jgi:hypothetical protein
MARPIPEVEPVTTAFFPLSMIYPIVVVVGHSRMGTVQCAACLSFSQDYD